MSVHANSVAVNIVVQLSNKTSVHTNSVACYFEMSSKLSRNISVHL